MKVLILEDSTETKKYLQAIVQEEVQEVEIQALDDHIEALNIIKEGFRPDLAFMDNNIHGRAVGHELARTITNHYAPDCVMVNISSDLPAPALANIFQFQCRKGFEFNIAHVQQILREFSDSRNNIPAG